MTQALENMSKEQLIKLLNQKESLLVEKKSLLEKKDTKINDLKFQLEQFKRLLFGSKRERFIAEINSDQMLLPFEVDQAKVTEEVT